jgi:hypothetical protein
MAPEELIPGCANIIPGQRTSNASANVQRRGRRDKGEGFDSTRRATVWPVMPASFGARAQGPGVDCMGRPDSVSLMSHHSEAIRVEAKYLPQKGKGDFQIENRGPF